MSPRADVPAPTLSIETSGFCGDYEFTLEQHDVRAANRFSSVTARLDVVITFEKKDVSVPDNILDGVSKILAVAPYCNEGNFLSMRIVGIDEDRDNIIVKFVGFKDGEHYRQEDVVYDGGQFVKEVQ